MMRFSDILYDKDDSDDDREDHNRENNMICWVWNCGHTLFSTFREKLTVLKLSIPYRQCVSKKVELIIWDDDKDYNYSISRG